jgi:hypothetical protein
LGGVLITSSKPIIVHLSQELWGKRKARARANDRINAAPGTKGGRANPVALVYPILDFSRQERLATVEATASLARPQLIAMIARAIMR